MIVRGIDVPNIFYGTAWKEERTEALVTRALGAGFRGIDTANQRKHYHEAGVGLGIAAARVPRAELFVQTKFTHEAGQDHRLPYDPRARVEDQVAQSFASSLEHLGLDRIDSLVMHGPTRRDGLGPDDHAAWRGMEALPVALLGISNVDAAQVDAIVAFARVRPAFVQNRCYANRGWDRDVRQACARHGLIYQAFSLLTANRQVVAHRAVRAIADRHGRTAEQIIFRFAHQLEMIPLTGTTDVDHMRLDLATEFELDPGELSTIERLA